MINNIQIKSTLLPAKGLNIDFYDNQGVFIGNIDVSVQGKVSWCIADINYELYLLPIINYIMGENNIKRLNYETKDEKLERLKNALVYINYRGLRVNIKFNNEYYEKTKIIR